jgi:hypothetical protein
VSIVVSFQGTGEGAIALKGRDPDAVGEQIVRRYQAYAADEGVFDQLFECLRRNLTATKSQRVEGGCREAGFTYEKVADGMTQVAAARTLAQILRLMPQSAGVTVNNGPTNTLNVTTSDRLAELDSIGVPRTEIAKACADLLEASKQPNDVTSNANAEQKGKT